MTDDAAAQEGTDPEGIGAVPRLQGWRAVGFYTGVVMIVAAASVVLSYPFNRLSVDTVAEAVVAGTSASYFAAPAVAIGLLLAGFALICSCCRAVRRRGWLITGAATLAGVGVFLAVTTAMVTPPSPDSPGVRAAVERLSKESSPSTPESESTEPESSTSVPETQPTASTEPAGSEQPGTGPGSTGAGSTSAAGAGVPAAHDACSILKRVRVNSEYFDGALTPSARGTRYDCANADGSLALTITEYPSAEAARQAVTAAMATEGQGWDVRRYPGGGGFALNPQLGTAAQHFAVDQWHVWTAATFPATTTHDPSRSSASPAVVSVFDQVRAQARPAIQSGNW